jgi:hypothetical protein
VLNSRFGTFFGKIPQKKAKNTLFYRPKKPIQGDNKKSRESLTKPIFSV